MGMLEQVATAQLKVLFLLLVLAGNVFRAIPANTSEACGADLFLRAVLTRQFLMLTAVCAAVLLLRVRASVRAADAGAAARRRRRSLRGRLLLAVALSFAASVLAVVAFQDGLRYRTGCDAAYHAGRGQGAGMGVLMVGLFALMHGFFAWAAVTQD